MANTSSAKKAERVAERRRIFNVRKKRAVKDAVKTTGKAVAAKQGKEALASLPALYKAIDKAAKHGTIKKNTAARMKSRITKRIAALK
ncbi:30S ribosomal protein S20 [Candidatus Kaiserbacteria bacterium]|nr:30S ribosomal protein S20 [Candidatus Kaiserbacteria bacterium]